MSHFGYRYVVDNNTLAQLSKAQRSSSFFRNYAVIPSEVLFEARKFYDIEQLRQNEYPTSPSVLYWLKRVMTTISPSDTRLIDLYANEGNADPMLIACALDGQYWDSQYLDSPTWVVVSGDKAVRAKAEEFDLPAISNAEFSSAIDEREEDL